MPITKSEGVPPIESFDELIPREALMKHFGVTVNALSRWQYGYGYKTAPLLPYVRVGRKAWFSKRQIAWWLNELQESQNNPDTPHPGSARKGISGKRSGE